MDGDRSIRHTRKRVPPSKPGVVLCIGPCGKRFKSPDRMRVRVCNRCKRNRERLGLCGEQVSDAGGIDIPDGDDEF